MKILVTGIAGFIGFHLAKSLVEEGHEIIGIDNINNYYDNSLKYDRLKELRIPDHASEWHMPIKSKDYQELTFIRMNLEDRTELLKLFQKEQFDKVCHLAAQTGVRYSLENPYAYIDSNVSGFMNILEGCRQSKIKHLVFASSSSVYGNNTKLPYSTTDNVDHPISLYAATKRANELMAYSYSHLYRIPTTGLRFFTVYGPWGRPDMAYYLFTKAMMEGKPIRVFNNGNMQRDFTYIDDIVEGIQLVLNSPPSIDIISDENDTQLEEELTAPFKIYNIGKGDPINLLEFIELLEKKLGIRANKELLPMQAGDVYKTFADIRDLKKEFDYHPSTTIKQGVKHFCGWFVKYQDLKV